MIPELRQGGGVAVDEATFFEKQNGVLESSNRCRNASSLSRSAASACLRSVISCTVPTSCAGLPALSIFDVAMSDHPACFAIARADDCILHRKPFAVTDYFLIVIKRVLTVLRMNQARPIGNSPFKVSVDTENLIKQGRAFPALGRQVGHVVAYSGRLMRQDVKVFRYGRLFYFFVLAIDRKPTALRQ